MHLGLNQEITIDLTRQNAPTCIGTLWHALPRVETWFHAPRRACSFIFIMCLTFLFRLLISASCWPDDAIHIGMTSPMSIGSVLSESGQNPNYIGRVDPWSGLVDRFLPVSLSWTGLIHTTRPRFSQNGSVQSMVPMRLAKAGYDQSWFVNLIYDPDNLLVPIWIG